MLKNERSKRKRNSNEFYLRKRIKSMKNPSKKLNRKRKWRNKSKLILQNYFHQLNNLVNILASTNKVNSTICEINTKKCFIKNQRRGLEILILTKRLRLEESLNQNQYLLKSKKRKSQIIKSKKIWLKERPNFRLNEMQCLRRRRKKGKSNFNKKSKEHQQTHIQTSDSKNLKKSTPKQKRSKLKNSSKRKRKIFKETKTTPQKRSLERRKEAKIWNLSLELHLPRNKQRKFKKRKIKVRSERMCLARLNPRSLILIKLQNEF